MYTGRCVADLKQVSVSAYHFELFLWLLGNGFVALALSLQYKQQIFMLLMSVTVKHYPRPILGRMMPSGVGFSFVSFLSFLSPLNTCFAVMQAGTATKRSWGLSDYCTPWAERAGETASRPSQRCWAQEPWRGVQFNFISCQVLPFALGFCEVLYSPADSFRGQKRHSCKCMLTRKAAA